jgi:DNA polymerase-3 subunit epsilon
VNSLFAFKAMIRRDDFLVLDTETTGLERGEICQLALINSQGDILLNTLVKPVGRIPSDATRIHNITTADVVNAPGWAIVTAQLEPLLRQRDVIIYNAVYDRKVLRHSAEAARLPHVAWEALVRFWCAMEAFAEVYGARSGPRTMYRWQKLTTAARYFDLPIVGAHSALGDCRMTLAIARKMAGLE